MPYAEVVSKINTCSIVNGDDFDLFIDNVAVEVDKLSLSIAQKEYLIEQLLHLIERMPDSGFTSWSLVHFVEWLDQDNATNYNRQLLNSLKRKPKFLTLLLINRVLNDLPDTSVDRPLCLAALKEVASDSTLDDYIRNEANEFYEYQANKQEEK